MTVMSSLLALIFLIKILHHTRGQTGLEAPTIESVTGTKIGISFNIVEGADEYVVTAASRYDSSQTVKEVVRGTPSALLINLTPSTLYDISIQARNAGADLAMAKTKQQTHPGAPTLTTSTPLPNTFLVFLNTANRARVSQWTVEYRLLGTNISDVVTTEEDQYYVIRLVDLQPDTTYQVRGRASQIYSSVNLTETEAIFSDWYNFTTDSLSVFARVTFVGRSSPDNSEFSEEWNKTQQELEKAYENLTNLNSLDVVRKENETVYFRLKIKDKSFNDTSTSVYNLNGTQFTNFAVNNGDEAIGTVILHTEEDPLLWRLQYKTSTNMTEGGITNTFVILSPEETSQVIPVVPILDTQQSLANQDRRDFAFREDGKYVLEDGSEFDLRNNTVYGLEPKFLIRDFMKRQPNETLYALYYDIPGNKKFRFLRTTDMQPISTSAIANTSSFDGSSVTISFPSVDKATRYILTGNGATPWSLDETDIDGSERLTITVSSLTPGSTYEFSLTTTQRKHDGRTQNVTSNNTFTVEPTIAPTTTTVTTHTAASSPAVTSTVATTTADTSTSIVTTKATTTGTTDESTDIFTTVTSTVDTTTAYSSTATVTTKDITTTTTGPTTDETTLTTIYTTLPPECNFQSNMTAIFRLGRPHLSSTEFVLSWNNVSENYVVTAECIDCIDAVQNFKTNTPTMLFNSLEPGLGYRICVIAELCDSGTLVNRTDCETFLTNPDSVGNVSFVVGYSNVVIKWDAVPSATSYKARVFLTSLTKSTQTNQELANLAMPTATFNDLSPCDAYSVELTASNAGGESVPVRETFNTLCSSVPPTTSATPLASTVAGPTTDDPKESPPYTQTISVVDNTNTSSIWPNSNDTSTIQPKLAEGIPWWFIFALVLAIIISVACITAIAWYQKRRTGKYTPKQPKTEKSRV